VSHTRRLGGDARACVVESDAAQGDDSATVWGRIRRLRQAFRQMFGIPDYERYLAHMNAHHPGEPVLPEREFQRMAIERRYGAARPPCC
jgi:uncharacterized short protein YbdD (DUF466 family)